MKKGLPEAIATLVGATIGAGILAVPYFVSRSGLLIGIIGIIVIGMIMLMINLFLGEVSLRTKGNHQLLGFANKYLGKNGRKITMITLILGSYGSLIAYVLASGQIMSAIFGLSPFLLSILFIIFASIVIFIGIGAVKRWELWISSGLLFVLILITIFSAPHMKIENMTSISIPNMFLPYGIILFALFGQVAIAEMKEELGGNRKELKKAIIIGTLISITITLLFAIVVVGVVGLDGFNSLDPDKRIATIALGTALGYYMIIFANLFALCSITTSCLSIGYGLKETYHYDMKMRWTISWVLVILIPFIFFLVNSFVIDIGNFMAVVGFTGGICLSAMGILIVVIYRKAKKKGERKPEYMIKDRPWLDYLLILLFLGGMAYQIATMFI